MTPEKEKSIQVDLIEDTGTYLSLWIHKHRKSQSFVMTDSFGYVSVEFSKGDWEHLKKEVDDYFYKTTPRPE